MLVFTGLPPALGTVSLVWADVSLEPVNVSRKGASATKRYQNPSPSDLGKLEHSLGSVMVQI